MVRPLKIVHISSEISPYSKTGGLADVARSLPRALVRLGHEVVAFTPYYGFIAKKYRHTQNLKERVSVEFGGRKYGFGFKKIICPDNYPVIFICQRELFGSRNKLYGYKDDGIRFLLFNLASLKLLKVLGFVPQVIHCHDWHTGLIPNYLKLQYRHDEFFKNIGTLFTIHNLLFQGPEDWWKIPPEKKDNGKGLPPHDKDQLYWLNFALRGILYSDLINTVSSRYAQEILTPEYGCDLDSYLRGRKKDLYGIINGVDYTIFNPQFDEDLYVNYDANSLEKKSENKALLQKRFGLRVDSKAPLIGLANRLTEQKGLELIIDILDYLLKLDVQIAIVGSGGGVYRDFFRKVARKYRKKILFFSPFKEHIARKVYSASDIYLMPSRFEPCGISQLISLRYGSIPIVHAVGGLLDTISDYNPKTGRGNGFVFTSYTSQDLLFAIARALEDYKRRSAWKTLVRRAMKESYSWKLPAKKYVTLYRRVIRKRRIIKN